MSCNSELVRFDCFCVVHKVSVYCCVTSPMGSVDVGGGGGWSAIEVLRSSHSMQSKVSVGCFSPASTHWWKCLSPLWVLLIYCNCCIQGLWDVLLSLVILRQPWHLSCGLCHCQYLCALGPLHGYPCLCPRASCTSVAVSHSVHFIWGTVSLISVSNLLSTVFEW